jgi:RNA polymerase sigma-70 factor (ECF subfamily)
MFACGAADNGSLSVLTLATWPRGGCRWASASDELGSIGALCAEACVPVICRSPRHDAGTGELVIAIRNCEGASFGHVFGRHRPRLLMAALRLLGNRADAENAVRATQLIAIEHLGMVHNSEARVAWLYAVLCRVCLERLRPRDAGFASDRFPELLDAWAHPEQRLGRLEMRQWIRGVLDRLPDSLRDTAMLSYFGHVSHSEVAVRLDIPIGRVRSRLLETKMRLAEALLVSSGLVRENRRP